MFFLSFLHSCDWFLLHMSIMSNARTPPSGFPRSLMYCKVASSNMSCLEAHAWFFRLLMKGILDPYVRYCDLLTKNDFLIRRGFPRADQRNFRNIHAILEAIHWHWWRKDLSIKLSRSLKKILTCQLCHAQILWIILGSFLRSNGSTIFLMKFSIWRFFFSDLLIAFCDGKIPRTQEKYINFVWNCSKSDEP